jgi:cob(I)alamin adenosyltransferase
VLTPRELARLRPRMAPGSALQELRHLGLYRTSTPGYVHVYTGDGKSKTTAAFGLASRAAGHGKRVFVGQFMKRQPYGEIASLADWPLVDVEQFGTPGCICRDEVSDEHVGRARDGYDRARLALSGGGYDVVVLDEIDVAIWFGQLTVADALRIIDERPSRVELAITGRQAPREIIERADLVTEMREVKHYYRRSVRAHAGIEF